MPCPPPSLTPEQQLEADTIACYPTIIREPYFEGKLYSVGDMCNFPKDYFQFQHRRDIVIRKSNLAERRPPTHINGPLPGARLAILPHGPFSKTHKMCMDIMGLLDFSRARRIFILSASHKAPVRILATPPPTVRGYKTIYSDVPWPLDSELITAWNVTGLCEKLDVAQDRRECGIEVPLLYLSTFFRMAMRRCNPKCYPKLVPLFIGECNPRAEIALGEKLLLPYVHDPESMIIISTNWVKWGPPHHTYYSKGGRSPDPDAYLTPSELPQPWSTIKDRSMDLMWDCIMEFTKDKLALQPQHYRNFRGGPEDRINIPPVHDSILTEDWMLMLTLTLKPDGGVLFRRLRRIMDQPPICGRHAIQVLLAAIFKTIERNKARNPNRPPLLNEFEGRFIWLGHSRDKRIIWANDHSSAWVCGLAILQ
ncbi:hypothetical protein KEM54_004790 [Ascosphaera aggregata]|nr:hypothetical protein KEM54_004790 [Ascosphaera aggregata]